MSRIGFLKTLQIYVFGSLAAGLIRVLYATIRWECVKPDGVALDHQNIYAFWHGRMLMLPRWYSSREKLPLYMLISQHGDGRLIAWAIKLLGIRSVAGSSTRRGVAATLELMRRLEEGASIGITPDGPKGPRQVCKKGVVTLAQQAGIPVQPVTYSVQERWVIPSWDRMIVPRPFSRGVVVFAEPLRVEPDEDRNEARVRIQESLNGITEKADAYWDSH
jgi:lysophospholipid acyltransferase (LPLAT)-like uncharacterized protein